MWDYSNIFVILRYFRSVKFILEEFNRVTVLVLVSTCVTGTDTYDECDCIETNHTNLGFK